MLQHHHFGPDEERPLGLRARRGRLPSVRTGDPPSRRRLREYDDGTSHSHSGSSSSILQLVNPILWRRMDSLNLLHVTEKINDLPACLQPLILQMVRYSRYCMAYSFNNQACLPVGGNEIISTRVLSPVHDPRMR